MLPKTHFFASFLLMLVIWPFFGFWSLFVLLGGVFIDVDHYLRYIFLKKNWNLKKAYYFFKRRDCNCLKKEVYIFHTIETLILLIILSFFHKLFFITLIGWLLHISMDFFYNKRTHKIKFGKRPIFTDLIIKRLLLSSEKRKDL